MNLHGQTENECNKRNQGEAVLFDRRYKICICGLFVSIAQTLRKE